jgi:hypothetical protein
MLISFLVPGFKSTAERMWIRTTTWRMPRSRALLSSMLTGLNCSPLLTVCLLSSLRRWMSRSKHSVLRRCCGSRQGAALGGFSGRPHAGAVSFRVSTNLGPGAELTQRSPRLFGFIRHVRSVSSPHCFCDGTAPATLSFHWTRSKGSRKPRQRYSAPAVQ